MSRLWTPGAFTPFGDVQRATLRRSGQAPFGYVGVGHQAGGAAKPAIQFDASSSSAANAADDLSWSHVCSTRANRILIVSVRLTATSYTSVDVTYNGVAMTSLASNSGATSRNDLFGLVAPATGSNTIAITGVTTTPTSIVACALSFWNVKQFLSGVSATSSGSGDTSSSSSLTSTKPGAWIVEGFGLADDVSVTATGTGQTKRVERTLDATSVDACVAMSTSPTPGTGSKTLGYSWTGSLNWRSQLYQLDLA